MHSFVVFATGAFATRLVAAVSASITCAAEAEAALEDALAFVEPREDSATLAVAESEAAVFAGANIEDVIQGLLLLLEVQVGQLRWQQHRKATMHFIYSIVHVWWIRGD